MAKRTKDTVRTRSTAPGVQSAPRPEVKPTPRERLAEYRAKRRFDKTPEPPSEEVGEISGEAVPRGVFVVQKHDATRLHYDMRFEIAGAMMSFAVPKGPSYDPTVKRLAVEVEDHPMAYNTFEGRIPDGEYGAGDVILWDRGAFETVPPDAEVAMRAKGHLRVRLFGEKLRGEWHFVRTRGPRDERARAGKPPKPAWVLFKANDSFADPGYDVLAERPESVVSGRAATRGPQRVSASASGATAAELLEAVGDVCLAVAARGVDTPKSWLFELKYDGYRLLSAKAGDDVRTLTRNRNDWTVRFPEIKAALRALPVRELVVDGEVCGIDERGVPSFGRLQRWLAGERDDSKIGYVVFDLLWLDGRDVRGLAIEQRRELLAPILAAARAPLSLSSAIEGDVPTLLAAVKRVGMEGVVAKRRGSKYSAGRSTDWVKLKIDVRQDCVVLGYVPLKGTSNLVGAIFLGVMRSGALAYAGKVGTGFDDRMRRDLTRRFDAIATASAAVAGIPREKGARWTTPTIVVEVGYAEWSHDDRLRQARFIALREDKAPEQCTLEEPEATVSAAPVATAETVKITNPAKVLFPRDGIAKQEIVAWYAAVAPALLPHLAGRPLTLQRWPDGIDGEEWYQQNAPSPRPSFVRTVADPEHAGKRRVVCDNVETLLWLANLASLTLHVWPSHVPPAPASPEAERDALAKPDWVVLDLDPGDGPWRDVIEVAHAVRTLAEALGLTSVVKTTGKRGLHVLMPIARGPSHDDVVAFAAEVARAVAKVLPRIATAERVIARRGGRLYVDAVQNGAGRTIAAPYTVRARDGAPVSTPLAWSEVTEKLDPTAFTIRSVRARLDRQGDLFAAALEGRGRLPNAGR